MVARDHFYNASGRIEPQIEVLDQDLSEQY